MGVVKSKRAKTDENSLKNIYGDPPKINFSLPEISELTQDFKDWKDVQLPVDILLLTVKDCEFLSCYYYINDPFKSYVKGLGTWYFGTLGENQDVKLNVALMQYSEGSKVPGGALTVVKNAVTQLRPKAVFSVGHCGGMNQESTKLGDVVVSEKLTTYSYQKVKQDGKTFRGFITPVSREIAELIKCAGYGWNPPLKNPNERKVEVHCGEVLSGSELVQAEWRRDELVKLFPEAIAMETEGEGVFSAAHELKMEWVVIKGISGYADGTEAKETWQTFASVTAASLVANILNQCSIFEDWPHYKGGSTEHLPRPEVKCPKEESSSNDALTPKKGKTGLAVKQGVPSDEDLEGLSQKLEKWKTVGRRLKIEEARLTAFDNDNKESFEKSYKMLLHWKGMNGSAATYTVLHDALCHSWVNRTDLAEQFITGGSTKHLPPPKKKRRNEKSSPSDALTPKKRGGSTKHLPPPKKKRRNEKSSPSDALTPKKRDSSLTEFWQWCRNQLRARYNTMCKVKITPWDLDNTVNVNHIYIQVTCLQDCRKPDGTTEKKLRDSSEVFKDDEGYPIRRRILVYGRPGIGKSTYTQQVAVNWANRKEEILKKFNLLLLIRLQDVCGISKLCKMLKKAELLSADDPMAVDNLCEYVRQNQEKVLLILDGYDEYSGDKSSLIHQIWTGSLLRDCCVMITTRPVKEDELRMPSDAQFELNGFDSWEQKKQFARKILPDEEDVKGLLEYLVKHDLEEMAEIPLLLLMLCLLWKEKKHQLPTSRAEIHVGFIQTLLNHMATKNPENVATSIDEYQDALCEIGKLAFNELLEDRHNINFSKFPPGDLSEKLIHVGFFQVSKRYALNPEKIVCFLHKSVQEFLAAWFIVQEVKVKKNETVTCLSRMDTFEKSRKMAEVLKFVCELSSEAAGIVFDHLHHVGEKEGLTNYNFTRTPSVKDLSDEQYKFIRLCVDCLFCCPALDRLAVYSTFLSCVNHVVILDRKHSSTAAKTHFFKDATSFPNYLFHSDLRINYDDVLSISSDLNAVVLTCSGEIKDVEKYAELRDADIFLKTSGKRNFIYLDRITDAVLHPKLLPELIPAPVCSSQPPVDNLGMNEDNNIALSLTENRSDQTQHCLSLVREVELFKLTVEDFVLLKDLLPLLLAPRIIGIWGNVKVSLEGNSIESTIRKINFTDNLRSLRLSTINLTAECAVFIAESLHHSPNLRKLCLSFNPLHSGVSYLAENLHHTPQLTELELQDVQMGEKEYAALAASLQYLNKLERLNIGDNALGDGIIEPAKNLNSVPNLTDLNLSNTNIGEDEVAALACALKGVPKLRCLSLEGIQMTKTKLEELRTAVNKRHIPFFFTDYHVRKMEGGTVINQLLTEAELKKKGIRFRKEQDSDDDEDDEDDDEDEDSDDLDGDNYDDEDDDEDEDSDDHDGDDGDDDDNDDEDDDEDEDGDDLDGDNYDDEDDDDLDDDDDDDEDE